MHEKVEALLLTGESQSIAAPSGAVGGGGSSVPEKIRPAKKKGAKRGSAEARAAANTRHGNMINCWAEATQQPIKRTRNDITEEVARVHYPIAPCPPKLKCPHCPRNFAREQGRALHCRTMHPTPH
ncbi:unnamed protein product [Ascophyllum nodosum]